jgi:DNA-binding CsgD family transcriptional regulator
MTGLQNFIPTDYNSWKEISFQRVPRVAAIFSPHNPSAASLLPVFQRHFGHHPICDHWRRSGQHQGAYSWTDVTTRTDFERQELYNDFYRPLGIQHQLVVALDVQPSRLIYLALNRARSPFKEQERVLLSTIQPHVFQALRHIGEIYRLRLTLNSFETLVDRLNQGIICLSAQHRISWANKRARHYLQTYWNNAPQKYHLPDAVLNWLLPHAQKDKASVNSPRPLTVQGPPGQLVVRLLADKAERYLLLDEIPVQRKFNELTAYGLTQREAEVLGWIAQGKSNDETAAILGMCAQTVKKHLERIYNALGVANRTEAALKVQADLRPSSNA